MESRASKILRKHLGSDGIKNLFETNEPLWDDIIDSMNEALDVTTHLKTNIKYMDDKFYGKLPVTECCGQGPITNENYCSNCGRKIIK